MSNGYVNPGIEPVPDRVSDSKLTKKQGKVGKGGAVSSGNAAVLCYASVAYYATIGTRGIGSWASGRVSGIP